MREPVRRAHHGLLRIALRVTGPGPVVVPVHDHHATGARGVLGRFAERVLRRAVRRRPTRRPHPGSRRTGRRDGHVGYRRIRGSVVHFDLQAAGQ